MVRSQESFSSGFPSMKVNPFAGLAEQLTSEPQLQILDVAFRRGKDGNKNRCSENES